MLSFLDAIDLNKDDFSTPDDVKVAVGSVLSELGDVANNDESIVDDLCDRIYTILKP